MAEMNSNSDTFRKDMTSRTPPSLVQDGLGFHTWKIVLGKMMPSTEKAAPTGITVAKAESPNTMSSQDTGP
jgi:hypothetical protein